MERLVKDRLDVVVLYSSGHLGSMIVLNRMLKMKCYRIKAIVSATNVEINEKGFRKVTKQIRKSGFLFSFMLFLQRLIQAAAYGLTYVPFFRKRLKTSTDIAAELDIPLYQTSDINDDETREFLTSLGPDLLLSAYFPMILKKEALNIPSIGVLNIHPGWLPEYKGVMAYFWAVKNDENYAGVSVHWMDEGIDTGPLLARRKFRIGRKTTQEKVLIMTAAVGSRILHRIGKKLVKGKEVPEIDVSSEKSNYYTMPTADEYLEYRSRNKFFKITTLLSIIVVRDR